MSEPKLHHFVPRFHLARFADNKGRIWTFDKKAGKAFASSPKGLAAEKNFYKLPELVEIGIDPLFLERQFAKIEGEACNTTSCWLSQLHASNEVAIPDVTRQIMSDFLALQFFRTAEARELLKLFAEAEGVYPQGIDADEARSLHATLLCRFGDGKGIVADFAKRIYDSIWIFAKNNSGTSFITSDTPVQLKTGDNRVWLKGPGMFAPGVYVVFPITPTIILYCKERTYWKKLEPFQNHLSPVAFTPDMVEHENSGQVGMSRRFVFAPENSFDSAKALLADMDSQPGPLSPEHIDATISSLYKSPPL
jgi:hypothetical protein